MAGASPLAADRNVPAAWLGACLALAGLFADAVLAQESYERQVREAQTRHAAQQEARAAQARRERQRRLSASGAHARMPSTMYASTPSPPDADPHCPVLRDLPAGPLEDVYDRIIRERSGGDTFRPSGSSPGTVARSRPWAQALRTTLDAEPAGNAANHGIEAAAGSAASSGATVLRHVHLFPPASDTLRQGFVRVVNHSAEAGEVRIDPVDDGGRRFDALTLSIGARAAVHFNSGDLENGNPSKGLAGATGPGQGSWRLALSSDLDIEVLAYVRTRDGFLTAMHDVAPSSGGVHRIAILNPGSNRSQASRLRLVNPTDAAAEVAVRGTDDRGRPGAGHVTLTLDAGAARGIAAAELESGAAGLSGALGDGAGKWRLEVESESPVVAMSLLESPTGHLTNLSTVPPAPAGGRHAVPLFPAAGDASGRQGFLRVVNRSETAGEVRIEAFDGTDRDYPPPTLSIGAGETAHFNSDDLEQGNARKGLSGGTGAGEGDWRLELASALDIEVLAYIRTQDGFLTAMHDAAPAAANRHRVAVFNPGSNRRQESLLRLVNPGGAAAAVAISGIDDAGASGAGEVRLTVPAGRSRTLSARELEDGGDGLTGSLGDGAGKWRLTVESDAPVTAMSLLRSPTGHLTNLSTAPGRPAGNSAEDLFRTSISPIVQSKCVNCHVEGGLSGNTRLVFVRAADDADHLATNLAVFRTFASEVDGAAELVLNKIQGVDHGGGIQVASGTDGFAAMERFVGLLGGGTGGGTSVTVATLFDGVEMDSARSTLRRAAIIFAGRVPTDEEYAAIRGATFSEFRAAVRELMSGPGFHEFLIRGANDRLLTDRDETVIDGTATDDFVDFSNLYYNKVRDHQEAGGPDPWQWYRRVQYGIRRAPLELVAHVAENDLPYTDVLTADYIMANPPAAAAYGASTAFRDAEDDHEFRPSEIASYYRDGPSKVSEFYTSAQIGMQAMLVKDPGDLATDYPHAGILNTTVFLLRYPTTATNRNRARSRWTYYHFLGLDVEKSASRTTDPVALADTNNPTMHNPACTVCHSVLDPVAGAYQNYGEEGFYRDKWEGLDAIDRFYKHGAEDEPAWAAGRDSFEITARRRSDRQTVSVAGWLGRGTERIRIEPRFDPPLTEDVSPGADGIYWHPGIDHVTVRNANGRVVKRFEPLELAETTQCGSDETRVDEESGEEFHETWFCPQELFVDIPSEGFHELEVVLWETHRGARTSDERRRVVSLSLGGYQRGDTWYRDMRKAGFDAELAPNADSSLQWLADRIVADPRFAEATVKFWWPVVMGSDVAEPPSEGEADFQGRLLASHAQAAEVKQLADSFRRGFRGGKRYNLKDLLTEIALSKWFRANTATDGDAVRTVALANAGAKRLLTPEELARKTVALTGFDWRRARGGVPGEPRNWTGTDWEYGLLYGGIDSDGITKRGRDLTSVMAGVAQRHASAAACPVVMKDLYLLPARDRRLLGGIDQSVTPRFEFGSVFEIEAASSDARETLRTTGRLPAGEVTVYLSFLNDFWDEASGDDRNVLADNLTIRRANGGVVHTFEFETGSYDCGGGGSTHWNIWSECTIEASFDLAEAGTYDVEVVAWADQAGDELAKLGVSVETDTERSAGARAIKAKLAELHDVLLGVPADSESPDVQASFDLFVDVWHRRQHSDDGNFRSLRCNYWSDDHYFDSILEDVWVTNERGEPVWDWDRVDPYMNSIDWSDPHYVARTWVVVLAYLMTDPRYLHL